MFEHFTFAASSRPGVDETSGSIHPSPTDSSCMTPLSPLLSESSLCQAVAPNALSDLTSTLETQTFNGNHSPFEPIHLYDYTHDYAYGLPSPSDSAGGLELDDDPEAEFNCFPIAEDKEEGSSTPMFHRQYRSTRRHYLTGADSWRVRRMRRQAGTILLCSKEKLAKELEKHIALTPTARTSVPQAITTNTTTKEVSTQSTETQMIPSPSAQSIRTTQSLFDTTLEPELDTIPTTPIPEDEGFFDYPSPENADDDTEEEAVLQAFQLSRASARAKFKGLMGMSNSVYRSNLALNRPRMRREITWRIRDSDPS